MWIAGLFLFVASSFGQIQAPIIVTKANQAALGLDFKLVARQIDGQVKVRLDMSRNGKLGKVAGSSLLVRDTKELKLLVPMAVFDQPDGPMLNFMLSAPLAADATIALSLPTADPPYEIRLREYITTEP